MSGTSGIGAKFALAALVSLASALLCALVYAAQPPAIERVGVLNLNPSSTLEEGIRERTLNALPRYDRLWRGPIRGTCSVVNS
jgi:hypothetical protein